MLPYIKATFITLDNRQNERYEITLIKIVRDEYTFYNIIYRYIARNGKRYNGSKPEYTEINAYKSFFKIEKHIQSKTIY